MEIDETNPPAEGHLAPFEASLDNFPFRHPTPHEIEERRVQMNDVLIYDIVLGNGGIRHPGELYPPTDPKGLERLIQAIMDCSYDRQKKESLIYYLLKFHGDGRETKFAHDRRIAPQFTLLTDAYWYLDTGINPEKAISALSDKRVSREFTSKVIQALSLEPNSSELIRQYVITVKPSLIEPRDMDAYVVALADSSLMEAWQYQRTFSETSESRPRLIRRILDWALMPTPKPAPLKDLLTFPFSNFEQTLIHNYSLRPPSELSVKSMGTIQDLVCMRLLQSGQSAAAVKLDHQFASLARGRTSERAQERRQTLDEVVRLMPAAERMLLELELEELDKGTRRESLAVLNDLSMSWEHVRPPPVSVSSPAKAAPARAMTPPSNRMGAPNFAAIPPRPSPQAAPVPTATLISAPPGRAAATSPLAPKQSASSFAPSRAVGGAPFAGPSGLQFSISTPRPPTSAERPCVSASHVPNAFYTPSVSAGTKRPFGQDGPRVPSAGPLPSMPASKTALEGHVSPPKQFESISAAGRRRSPIKEQVEEPEEEPVKLQVEEPVKEDVKMEVEQAPISNGTSNGQTEITSSTSSAPAEDANGTVEFSKSIFGLSFSTGSRSDKLFSLQRRPRNMPPGAFMMTSDDDSEPERPLSPPTPPPPVTSRRTRKQASETVSPTTTTRTPARSRRSAAPKGGAMTEGEDAFGPLPETPARRKMRKSRTTVKDSEDGGRPRRSTRLSGTTLYEINSPDGSPEKVIAKTPRRSARATVAAAGGGEKKTRRKR